MKKEKAIKGLELIIEFSLYGMIFTLPFSKSLIEIFFVVAMLCWIVKRRLICNALNAFRPVRTMLDLPIAGFVLVGFLSTVNSVSFSLSLEGFFFKLLQLIILYFIVVETIDDKVKLNKIVAVLFFSIAFIIADGIFQLKTGTDFIRNYSIGGHRIQGPFGNPNSFAGWLTVMIPLTLSLAYFSKNDRFNLPERYVWFKKAIGHILWIMTGLLILCLAFTYSRGGWLACVCTLILLGIFKSKKLLAATLAILLISLFVIQGPIYKGTGLSTKISEGKIDRPTLWSEALNIVEDFPLLGSGLNTYAKIGPYYRITEETGVYPHNSYLHMAAESGILGLGTFLWVIITLFWASLANLKKIHDRFVNTVLIGLLASLFGLLAHSFVDTDMYTLQLSNLMWFIMGLIVAAQKVHGSEIIPPREA